MKSIFNLILLTLCLACTLPATAQAPPTQVQTSQKDGVVFDCNVTYCVAAVAVDTNFDNCKVFQSANIDKNFKLTAKNLTINSDGYFDVRYPITDINYDFKHKILFVTKLSPAKNEVWGYDTKDKTISRLFRSNQKTFLIRYFPERPKSPQNRQYIRI